MSDLCGRFVDRNIMDVVEEFNKLRKEGMVQSYQLKFEELKSLMLILNPHLTEGYFVFSFVSRLSEELRPIVKMQQPRTIKLAIECARLQELIVEALMRKQRGQMRDMNSRMI